jgi:hypothetical protein
MKLVTTAKIAKISRSTNNMGIPVISLSIRSYGRTGLVTFASIDLPFYLHFSKINQLRYRQCNQYIYPISGSAVSNTKHHPKQNQRQRMTPNKLKDFQSAIKGILEFMNGRNLHLIFVFFLHTFIVPTKFLKSNVFLRKKEKGLTYCVTYLAILNYVKYSIKKIERQTNKLSIGYYYDKLNKSTNYGYMS